MEAIKTNLRAILDKMDVPKKRKLLTPQDLRWLARNLYIKNRSHSEFPSAIHFIHTLLVMQGDKNPLVIGKDEENASSGVDS